MRFVNVASGSGSILLRPTAWTTASAHATSVCSLGDYSCSLNDYNCYLDDYGCYLDDFARTLDDYVYSLVGCICTPTD